jgi:MoaA/NifB/PqqE/SkfB family radical SAM enzyme
MSTALAARCVGSGLHTLHVSIDAANGAIYEAIRLGARFDTLLRNLRRLQDAKREARRANASAWPHIAIVMVLMRRNLDELPALVGLASREGAESLSVQQLCHDFSEAALPPQYRSMRDFVDAEALADADLPRAQQVFDEARRRAQTLGLALRLPRLARAREVRGRCDWPWRGAYLSYDGRAMPCCMVGTPDRIHFGNAAHDGVAAVWNGSAYQAFREQLASPDPPAICAGCAVYRGRF